MSAEKYRHEYKYVIDARQQKILKLYAAGVLNLDSHTDRDGEYLIRSLYFDSLEYDFYYENEEGYDPRKKFRIRFYNLDSSYIVLECKAKIRTMTRKTSCLITEEQCRIFMEGRIPEADGRVHIRQPQMFYEMRMNNLRPVVVVQYVRIPYVNTAGNVRVTFDDSIASSNDLDGFLKKDIPFRQVLPKGQSVLEVKWDEFLPTHIKEQMELDSLQWTAFSKYYLCRKYNCYGGIRV